MTEPSWTHYERLRQSVEFADTQTARTVRVVQLEALGFELGRLVDLWLGPEAPDGDH